MELNETVPAAETTEPVVITEPVEAPASDPTEPQTIEMILVDIDRPFLETAFIDYTVSEGLLLLLFVIVLLQFFLNLLRR